MEKGKALVETNKKLNALVSNKFQPPPEIVEEEHKVNKEVINSDLKQNQIRIKLTGSETLRAANATYVKYHFQYNEDNPKELFENQFDIHRRDPQEFIHQFPQTDFDKIWKGLSEREIVFDLKKQKAILAFYKTVLDT